MVAVEICVGQFAEERSAISFLREHNAVPLLQQFLAVVVVVSCDFPEVTTLYPWHFGDHHIPNDDLRLRPQQELLITRHDFVQLFVLEYNFAVELSPVRVPGHVLLPPELLRLTAHEIQVREHIVLRQQVVLVEDALEDGAVLEVQPVAVLHAHDGLDQQLVERGLEHGLVGHFHARTQHAGDHRAHARPQFVERVEQRKRTVLVLVGLLDFAVEVDELRVHDFVHVDAEVTHED